MLALSVEKLDVRFPGLPVAALDIASLALAAGDHIAVTGPSGSGKTTLMNVLTGMERPSGGRVAWGADELTAMTETQRDRWRAHNVGLVMQEFHLFPGLSALDNVLLPQKLARYSLPAGMKESARSLLARVGIERLDQPIETMSRGQMQRVAVARALVGRPGLIVADEPTASLDAEAGEAVADLLLELSGETGATLLVASHDSRLIDRLGRTLRLENGRLLS
ncbi:ABC transporter ATP-binding protein [Shinella daejeonensis]|uniref:ABC transporter ATP-binding protein n=1 Tax=Shinella daejeonensis TaxID=659017 RepID=UPI0020C7A6CD|nr:ABC transporter ATP-binding protein [Shinella daejeonensis]MCP8894917.1 ABC transporter ATP-binding protein [Shinella daejeonensis]